MANAKLNWDKFEHNYANPVLSADDLEFFSYAARLPNGPRKLLALAEDWCGDVYRELPRPGKTYPTPRGSVSS